MTFYASRRAFLAALATILVNCTKNTNPKDAVVQRELTTIEKHSRGRLGVYALEVGSGKVVSYRENERFALCSTFKWVLVAAVLSLIERNELSLDQVVEYDESRLLDYAPITREHLSPKTSRGKMSIQELAIAAIKVSDNCAANLLLDRIGGPTGLTKFLRKIGDPVTRLDRVEPLLNSNIFGDPRDITSPRAMANTLRTVLLGTHVLSQQNRELLFRWMCDSTTGAHRIRAGLPQSWQVGDKTGTCGQRGAVNDVAIARRPHRSSIVMAVYMSESTKSISQLSEIHVEVGRLVTQYFT
jgi:beta-lactamase class A